MKNQFLITVLLGTTMLSNAQFSMGPKFGLGYANVKQTGDGAANNPMPILSPTVGLDTKVHIAPIFSIQTAIQATILGYKTANNGVNSTTYLGYVQIPLKLNFQLKLAPKLHIGIGAGPYVGYFVGGAVQDNSVPGSDGYKVKAKNTVSVSDQANTDRIGYNRYVDYGIVVAPFIQIAFLQIAPTATFGLANTVPTYTGRSSPTSKNLYYGLQVSFFIGGI